jgi:hypothetical protein
MKNLLILLCFFYLSCQNKVNTLDCNYTIAKHEKLITDSTVFKKYSDSLFIIYDERINNVGFIYYFRKKDSLFNDCMFFKSDSTYGLEEFYDFKMKKIERDGSLVHAHSHINEKNGTSILIYYHLMNREIKNALFQINNVKIKVKVEKHLLSTNEYNSGIFVEELEEKDLHTSKMFFTADIVNCDGSIEKINERISFKKF